MITNLNFLDNATLWVAISFVIFVFLVFKPLKNMMLTSLDKKIAELKLQLEESKKLKVKVSNDEIDKILRKYKKLKRKEKSNLSQVKKLGLVDKHGRPLNG